MNLSLIKYFTFKSKQTFFLFIYFYKVANRRAARRLLLKRAFALFYSMRAIAVFKQSASSYYFFCV